MPIHFLFLIIENPKSWQPYWSDNKEWHWTAFTIYEMFLQTFIWSNTCVKSTHNLVWTIFLQAVLVLSFYQVMLPLDIILDQLKKEKKCKDHLKQILRCAVSSARIRQLSGTVYPSWDTMGKWWFCNSEKQLQLLWIIWLHLKELC